MCLLMDVRGGHRIFATGGIRRDQQLSVSPYERLEGGHVDHRPLTNKVSPRAILVLSRVGLYTFGLRVLRGPVSPPLGRHPFLPPLRDGARYFV